VIGIRSRIDKESTVINTYMMGSDYYQTLDDILNPEIPSMGIGKRCFIKNTILDKNSCIGDDVRIMGGKHLKDAETETYAIRDGIVVIKKGAVIPSGFTI
jgi:glucose-1-phosphate adenylyltransferase